MPRLRFRDLADAAGDFMRGFIVLIGWLGLGQVGGRRFLDVHFGMFGEDLGNLCVCGCGIMRMMWSNFAGGWQL